MAVTTDPLSAAETAEAVRTGAVGALATLDAAFDRVGDLDPSLHAFTSLLRADGRAAGLGKPGPAVGTDAHAPENVARAIPEAYDLLRRAGYREITVPTKTGDRRTISLD